MVEHCCDDYSFIVHSVTANNKFSFTALLKAITEHLHNIYDDKSIKNPKKIGAICSYNNAVKIARALEMKPSYIRINDSDIGGFDFNKYNAKFVSFEVPFEEISIFEQIKELN